MVSRDRDGEFGKVSKTNAYTHTNIKIKQLHKLQLSERDRKQNEILYFILFVKRMAADDFRALIMVHF